MKSSEETVGVGSGGGVSPRGPLLAVGEVAERMSVTTRFVRRLIAERRIRYYKLGRHVRLAQDDVDEWVRQRSVEPSRQ